MSDTKRTYTKRSSRWYEKSGDRRTLLYNQAALASPIGQKMKAALQECLNEFNLINFGEFNNKLKIPVVPELAILLAEIAEIEGAK